jgi:MoaE-MoaD fusion protein
VAQFLRESPPVKINLLLFATLKDAAGVSQLNLDVPHGATVAEAKAALAAHSPKTEKWLPHVRVAVNQEYTSDEQTLEEGDELAFIPPVSGGSDVPPPFVAVVEHELSLDEVVRAVRLEKGAATGAICTFLGVVRENSVDPDGKRHDDIEFLEYEAYVPMAEKELRRIVLDCREKWGVACAITHRIGRLGVGEASVAIAVASAHRGPGLDACRYAIETLKKQVPIWKKETAADGFWWVEGSS